MPAEAAVEAVSGAAGSILALLATYPLKTIYTIQALSDAKGTAVLSVLDIITKYRLQGLYVGIEPNILESGISSAVYFYLYSKLRQLAVQSRQKRLQARSHEPAHPEPASAQVPGSTKNQDIGILASLLVAALAGAGNQLVTLPASVVATRMQARQKQRIDTNDSSIHTGALSVIVDIWRESGLGGFWSGLIPSLILVVNPAVQYMVYEQLLRVLRKWKQDRRARQELLKASAGEAPENIQQDDDNKRPSDTPRPEASKASSGQLSAWEIFLASALAKICATVVTYPMVVVKSRVQAGQKSKTQQSGTLHAIGRMFQDEGFGGFFKGLKAKILQTALNAALMLMLKEQCYSLALSAMNGGLLSGRGPANLLR